MTNKTPHQAAWTSPGDRIEFPIRARVGMSLVKQLLNAGAPEPKLIAAIAAAAREMSPSLGRIWIDDARRIGLISEMGRAACLELCRSHIGTAATADTTAH